MLAVKGYYDGKQIVLDENDRKNLNIGDEVIITILDRLDRVQNKIQAEKRRKVTDLDKYVMPATDRGQNADDYIRELRDNDRI